MIDRLVDTGRVVVPMYMYRLGFCVLDKLAGLGWAIYGSTLRQHWR